VSTSILLANNLLLPCTKNTAQTRAFQEKIVIVVVSFYCICFFYERTPCKENNNVHVKETVSRDISTFFTKVKKRSVAPPCAENREKILGSVDLNHRGLDVLGYAYVKTIANAIAAIVSEV
jgi:hypothetical protein